MSLDPHLESLENAIQLWADKEIERGELVPDFWDELNTSERLANWLIACGWRQIAKPFAHRPNDIISVNTAPDDPS